MQHAKSQAPVAQLAEHFISNEEVSGSKPDGGSQARFLVKARTALRKNGPDEGATGVEPVTSGSAIPCSATELNAPMKNLKNFEVQHFFL